MINQRTGSWVEYTQKFTYIDPCNYGELRITDTMSDRSITVQTDNSEGNVG